MPKSIANLQAKLLEKVENDWRKRVPQNNTTSEELEELNLTREKNYYYDELSGSSILDSKRNALQAASKQWKTRIKKTDALTFSVSGRMNKMDVPEINIEKKSNTPQPRRYKGDCQQRTFTLNYSNNHTFKSIEQNNKKDEILLSVEDFDVVKRESLLAFKKYIKPQKRKCISSKNPIKVLVNRNDVNIKDTDIITGIAEKEKERLKYEKLAKKLNKTVEVLKGLAGKEDYKSITLKQFQASTYLPPYKDIMLIQIKGRKCIQVRLVKPSKESINEGDCYVLITTSALFLYIGSYSNVIEQSKALDFVRFIKKTGDMGCTTSKIYTVSKNECHYETLKSFWKILKSDNIPKTVSPGHPDEDVTYETNILHTNMIYKFVNNEWEPLNTYWGTIPRTDILDEYSILLFDYGTEMYFWTGKNACSQLKKIALNLAEEFWSKGYNYSECTICPLNIAELLGDRPKKDILLKGDERPVWCLFTKLTQNGETILFKEKFFDWPDLFKKEEIKDFDFNDFSFNIAPCNAAEMIENKTEKSNLRIQDMNVGRGDSFYDKGTNRQIEITTIQIKAWKILENSFEELENESIANFYSDEVYIYNWKYSENVKGRCLDGNPSKYNQVGKEHTTFFCWQGNTTSVNKKCASAYLILEINKENAPQIIIAQGSEPAAFLRLFNGKMLVHNKKRKNLEPKMYIVNGEFKQEIFCVEVPCHVKQLRSRTCFIILNKTQVFVWYGSKSSKNRKINTINFAKNLLNHYPKELNKHLIKPDLKIVEIQEGGESKDFMNLLGSNNNSYISLQNSNEDWEFSMRLFHFTTKAGQLTSNEIICQYSSEISTPYPFQQLDLYAVTQPALFLIDNNYELWLWQGCCKETEINLNNHTGSGFIRWQAERKAAMETAIDYWKTKNPKSVIIPAYLVWAGLEPLEFQNLFSSWSDQCSIYEEFSEKNIRKENIIAEKVPLVPELLKLSQSTYSIESILQRPLPEGVDPTRLEMYLSPEDFHNLMKISLKEFQNLPSWKQTALKKENGLF
ncbi:unnamed protein product [Brassicogethes aeneus]|uniref:HP domain-containing protein n=1 Tax=Brassicogethes aeneus TaxID=1431903 RepID=A0A9P0FBQ5_BRAAE|nr:unnamed protein product [Brassicogethes aeneus]